MSLNHALLVASRKKISAASIKLTVLGQLKKKNAWKHRNGGTEAKRLDTRPTALRSSARGPVHTILGDV